MASNTDTTQTRYFKLDTRDRSFQAHTYYAAWRFPTALLFFIDEDGKAQVLFTLNVPQVDELRRAVQEGVTDVVGFEPLAARPDFNDVDFARVADRIDATTLGSILEV